MTYVICFIAKVLAGSIAIGLYQSCADIKNDTLLTLIYAIVASFLTVVCMGITIWQFS